MVLLLAVPLAATPQEPPSTAQLLARLADRSAAVADVRTTLAALHDRGAAVHQSAFDALRRTYGDQVQACSQQRTRFVQRFAKAVPDVQQALQGRGGEARIATLRKQARGVTVRPDLTKEMIHAELDPILTELRGMLLPLPAQVLERERELADELATLRQREAELDQWYDVCLEAAHALDQDPEGRKHLARAGLPALPGGVGDLDAELARQCVLALPLDAGDRRALEDNETLRAHTDAAEFAGTLELNRIRMALGLNALRIDEKLGNAARDHSQDMHTLKFFAHESPVEGKRTFGDRASRAGTSASSENIAQGHSRGEGAIEAWWYSPGHHKNMLGSHGRTGLGRFAQTWTQLFGG
ncbi:MAG: CAP domain-containing protein [Planctomycetes bacterium]|nr:CAP domain-containing protein [Planctomycetota bacterium]